MSTNFRVMAVLAHPDDESLGVGGTLARCAVEGIQTFLVTATRGENGRHGFSRVVSPEELGQIRERELLAASRVLGLAEVRFLGYQDADHRSHHRHL